MLLLQQHIVFLYQIGRILSHDRENSGSPGISCLRWKKQFLGTPMNRISWITTKLRVLLGEKNQSVSRISVVLDSILFWSQKINQQKDQNALIRHEMDFEIKAYKEREEELARNINRQLFIRSVLWKILGFFVLIATFIFYYKQKQIKQQKRESQKSLEEAARELALAHEQLNDFKNSLIEKSKRLEILESEVELTANDQDLENLRVKTILTEGEWVKFKELFERVHTGYFTRLKSRFPGLTQGEIRFCFDKIIFYQ
ncbi:MAG: hypothetical protein IPI30_21710 [Saprospiraceae bacterium]|nr:hypothetical protein [Candidatus Vicinibacter affinis]